MSSSPKQRISAQQIKDEIDARLMALDGGKHKCCACRVGLPRSTNKKESLMHASNWIVETVQPTVAGCDQEVLTAIVWAMRRFDCADWE